MRQRQSGWWLAGVLFSAVASSQAQAQSPTKGPAVRPTGAGTVEISDLRPTSGVRTKQLTTSTPQLLEVESGVELQPVVPSKQPGGRPTKTAPRPAPKTRVIEIPTKSAPKTEPTVEPQIEAPDELESKGAAEDAIELNRKTLALRDRLRRTLNYYYHRKLNTRENTHWEVMHQIVAYGVKAEVRKNSARGEPVNAISWLCWNQPCSGEKMLYTLGGLPAARQGPRVQGHEGQFLKMLAMSGVSSDYPMLVDGKHYKIADLVEQEKLTCRPKMELTFKLISLAYYLDDLDQTWRSRDGQLWNIERLIREELQGPILRDAACGGTHRLMGFSMALRERRRAGQPIDGEFERADKFINDYVKYTLSLQNLDGSFSTEWFRRREAEPNLDRRLQTTGHILEWLVFTVPDEMLVDARIVRAVEYLARILDDGRARQWEIGPLGHSLHALSIYERRVSYLESNEGVETPETEPAPKAPVKPIKPAPETTAPEKSEPEQTAPEKATPKKAVPEKAAPEVSVPEKAAPKKTKGPIKLPPDAQRMDEVEPGISLPKAKEPAAKKAEPKKVEPKKVEPKPEVKIEAEPKLDEPKLEPKAEPKVAPKAEPKAPAKAETKLAQPKKLEPKKAPKQAPKKVEPPKAAVEPKTGDEDDLPSVEKPTEEGPKAEQPKSESPKTEEPTPAEEPKPTTEGEKPAEPQAEAPEAKKPDEKKIEEKKTEEQKSEEKKPVAELPAEPKLPGSEEPTPAEPEAQPAEEKAATEKPATEKPAEAKPATEKSVEEQPTPEKSAETPDEKSTPEQEPTTVVEPTPAEATPAPAVIKSAPLEQSEPSKTPGQAPIVEGEVLEPTPAEAPADEQPAVEKPAAKSVEEPQSDKADPFREPEFNLDPLDEPSSEGARGEPRNLDADDLSRAGRLPPVEGRADVRTPAQKRAGRPTAPDLWDSPVFDPHREQADELVEREVRALPAPPVEAVDSPSQPVARVGGRTFRPAKAPTSDPESTFPKLLKRRLGILFVPKSVVPAR